MIEELARVNATAIGFTTHSEIVAPYIVAYGSEEQKQCWLPKMVSGEMIGVIAMSEPGIGSDLRSMRASARREGDSYVVNGQKTFITNGGNADLMVTATKLDPAAKELTRIGKTVFDFQNTKFKLAECKAQATMLRVFVDDCLGKAMRGELSPEVGAMCKLLGSEMQGKVLDELLQLHGGYGFMSEYKISRAWVDARVARIYGGTSEIMKEIIARSL
jgi:alkylation response protein AidB-like acyl-CoA dehydrogenase